MIAKGPPDCWLVPSDAECYNDHRAIASTLMDFRNGAQFGPKAAVCGGYEGGSDNRYDCPIISCFSDAYSSASCEEGTKHAMSIFTVADISDLPYKVVLFSNQLD